MSSEVLSRRLVEMAHEVGSEGRLPSERQLSRQLNSHRLTVHRAMGLLERQGLIERHGRKTFVTSLINGAPVALLQFQISTETQVSLQHMWGSKGVLAEAGRELLPMLVLPGKNSADLILKSLHKSHVGGVILNGFAVPDDVEFMRRVSDEFPSVVTGKELHELPLPCVQSEAIAPAAMLTRWLADRGCRTLVGVGSNSTHTIFRRRCEAFQAAAVGLEYELPEILWEPDFETRLMDRLRQSPRPLGVFTVYPGASAALARWTRKESVEIGKDICVAGFEHVVLHTDIPSAVALVDDEAVGRAGAALLLRRLEGKTHPREIVEVPCKMVFPAA